jgi:hypothetical protein
MSSQRHLQKWGLKSVEETSAFTVTPNDQNEGATDEVQRLRHGGQFHHEIVSPHKEAQRVATQTVRGVTGAQGHLTSQTAKKPTLWTTRHKAARQNTGEITAAPVNYSAKVHNTSDALMSHLHSGHSSTDSLLRESIKVVYVISRQTQYIVINSTDAVPFSGPTAQTIETQPWWENTLHSGSDAMTLQEVKPDCADHAQQMPCSRTELPPTRHESGAADKENTETTSIFTSSKSLFKAAKKKVLTKTRSKIKRRRARKREAELISFKEFAPFIDLTDKERKCPNPQQISETTNGSLFGSAVEKVRLDSCSFLLGKASFNSQSIEESEPNSAGAYTDHPALVLKQYSQGIMSQFGNLSDSDEEGNDELDDAVACMMKTERWKAAHRTLCENLVRIGLSADDAVDEAHNELIELVCNSIPGQKGTEDEINKCAQTRINSYLPLGCDITGYQITRQTRREGD